MYPTVWKQVLRVHLHPCLFFCFSLLLLLLFIVPPNHITAATDESNAAPQDIGNSFTPSWALPDLLTFTNGSRVASAAQWPARRLELKALLEAHILGAAPTSVPPITTARVLNSTTDASGAVSEYVHLEYGVPSPVHTVTFTIQVIIPASALGMPARGWPVFLTQWNHGLWANKAVNRGYIAIRYPGADTGDAGSDFVLAYPNATWMKIRRRAWVASRVVDYVMHRAKNTTTTTTIGSTTISIDTTRICITGHSRNGKQSLIAAAFDERITAVVGSSPGAPIAAPVRFSTPAYSGETVAFVQAKRDWWLPSLASYYGREQELPTDGHAILALVAPRHALLYTGWTDHEGDITFASEQGYTAARQVYRLLDVPAALRIKYRPGDHHGFIVTDTLIDWFDVAAATTTTNAPSNGGSSSSSNTAAIDNIFPEALLHASFDWEAWNASAGVHALPPPPPSAPLAERIEWLLGGSAQSKAGVAATFSAGSSYAEENSEWKYPSYMLNHNVPDYMSQQVKRMGVSFGDYVGANIYYPANWTHGRDTPLPVIVYLHGHSYSAGYVPDYNRPDESKPRTGGVYTYLAQRGHFVITFDQIGCASRAREGGATFYRRYPRASRLGRMVSDTRAAIDFAYCRSQAGRADVICGDGENFVSPYTSSLPSLPLTDMSRVTLVGYSLGGSVALHTAALDSRVAAVACFSGVAAWRSGGSIANGGLEKWAETWSLAPRLGLFYRESTTLTPHDVPYDFDDLLTAIAPRRILVHTPSHDREVVAADVESIVRAGQTVYVKAGASNNYTWVNPNEVSAFSNTQILLLYQWLSA